MMVLYVRTTLFMLAAYLLLSTTAASKSTDSAERSLPCTTFALEGSNGRYARLDTRNLHSNPLVFDSNSIGETPRDATVFLLDSQGGLIVSSTSRTEFGGRQAMKATNAGTNAVVFETPGSAGAGYTPLACTIDEALAFTCTVQGCRPSGGTISKAREWYLGDESGPQFTVKAVPIPNQQTRSKHASEHKPSLVDQAVLRKELRF